MKKQKLNLKSVLLLGLALAVAATVGIVFFQMGGSIEAQDAIDMNRTFSVLP